MLSFKNFLTVDYTPGMPDQISYNAMKRKRGRIGEDCVTEELSLAQRKKKAITMKRYKTKIAVARKRSLSRAASKEKIAKRARKQALTTLFKKFSKGKSRSDLTPTQRSSVEKRVAKMSGALNRITKKLIPQVRKQEKARRQGKKEEK